MILKKRSNNISVAKNNSPLSSKSAPLHNTISYEDWLDGLEKTVDNSVKRDLQDNNKSDVFIINPCALPTITKLMADAVC